MPAERPSFIPEIRPLRSPDGNGAGVETSVNKRRVLFEDGNTLAERIKRDREAHGASNEKHKVVEVAAKNTPIFPPPTSGQINGTRGISGRYYY